MFTLSDNDNVTITQDPVKATVSKSSSRKKDSEASFYSLYTAGSSLSIDLDIWEQEVGETSLFFLTLHQDPRITSVFNLV